MTVVGQPQVTYTYDNANRLTTITQSTSTVTIGYDDADRRTSVTYPNTNSITYAYNAASEFTSLTYKQGATTLGDLTYTYDAAGNRIKTGGTFARSNIPPALTTTNYNANNQQTTFGTSTETFDLNGNLATFTDASGTTIYTWNARNQLTSITGPSLAASFNYDSFDRRTGKTINGTTTNFLYDGLNPVQEKSGATVTANLLTGLGIDELFTRTDGVGVRSLLPDALVQLLLLEMERVLRHSTPMSPSDLQHRREPRARTATNTQVVRMMDRGFIITERVTISPGCSGLSVRTHSGLRQEM